MADHFTILHPLVANEDLREMIMAVAVGSALIAMSAVAARSIRTKQGLESKIVPEKRFSLFNFFDLFIEAFVKYHDSVLGEERRRFIPITGGIFIFIFMMNLVGLIPGFPSGTTTVWVNVAMALVVFVYFNYQGMKTQGVVNYLKHFCGPMEGAIGLILAPLLFLLEGIISNFLRIATLNLRLYWNVSADHMVLGTFTELIPYGIPVIFYGLGVFVSFMQAFVFTTLTMVYILLATQHAHSEHGHEESHAH